MQAWLQVANESQLVAELIKRVGPYADAALLERHLRAANGRLHWAGQHSLSAPAAAADVESCPPATILTDILQ